MAAQNPELQRLLASLKSVSQPITSSQTVQSNRSSVSDLQNHGTANPADINAATHVSRDAGAPLSQGLTQNLRVIESHSRSVTPTSAIPDASIITTWSSAIKHVAKHIINDEKVCTRIRHLISEQRKHEQQWWIQREAIVERHNGRADSNTKVAELLKELGGLATSVATVDTAAQRNELDAFDKKVYKSLVQMAADFDAQLRKMAIPFFAIKHELVSVDGQHEDSLPRKNRLDKGELRDLQKRMLQYLEDLLMDD